jgi:hypothetical protein
LVEPAQTGYLIDLLEEQGGKHGGHAYSDQVGKNDSYMENRIRSSIVGDRCRGEGDTRASSFPSLDAANKLVNSTLAQSQSIVDTVVNGQILGPKRINAIFGSPTGREAYTNRPWDSSASIFFRDTFGAAVVIIRNQKVKKGYSVITAFPFFD